MTLSKKKRAVLRMKFGGRCAYCGCELPEKGWHADHVEPVYREMKYVRSSYGGGSMQPTGRVGFLERDSEDNLFPTCRSCNIHKSTYLLEDWRKELAKSIGMLQRGWPLYRTAVRFGLVIENPISVVFWFEKYPLEVVHGQ
jgi:hypothetical protein